MFKVAQNSSRRMISIFTYVVGLILIVFETWAAKHN